MAQLTMAQAYAYARQAGFDPASAVIAAAIAAGESGLRTNARGDVDKTSATWGPSVGLMQIRTVKGDTGTGRDRDIAQLDDPLRNMLAAYHISHGGQDFTPWTVYTSGRYRAFVGQAAAAGAQSPPVIAGAPAGTVTATPASWSSDVTAAAQDWAVKLLVVGLGAGLVVAGTYRAWAPAAAKVRGYAKKAALTAATA